MTDLLVYWRDCRRNRATDAAAGGVRFWHSSSRLIGALGPGDRLWLVSSGGTLQLPPAHHGFAVEVWCVEQVVNNPGDVAAYPRERYTHRVLARLDPALNPATPRDVDAIVRPVRSPVDVPIGRLLQGPRRLNAEAVAQLVAAMGTPFEPPAAMDGPDATVPAGVDPDLIALGIRQPWAELILQGHKTIEVRTLETNVRGPIYLYAGKQIADIPAAHRAVARHRLELPHLPLSGIVGSVEITGCRPCTRLDAERACVPSKLLAGRYAWELANPRRIEPPLRPRFLPYGVWFYPFRRRNAEATP